MAITALTGLSTLKVDPASGVTGGTVTATGTDEFSNALSGLLSSTESSNADANQAISNMVQGTGDVHEAMIAIQRAEMTLGLTVQVRNKLAQAYQDVMRMPI
ncbi:MAG: flagellar hook-basal body complex protein FliE [Acidobacteria bacterium]|nr:flagellar hook-basal body complex protein FliE [Acidobacteriota bacterium]